MAFDKQTFNLQCGGEVMAKFQKEELRIPDDDWVSEDTKDLIRIWLEKDPKKRAKHY